MQQPEMPAVRIAMWSGPRNISTALMRSWESRSDTVVCDEPLYAYYLLKTGLAHPGAEEVIAHHECDWRKVASWMTGPLPCGKTIFYLKHMAHHLLPEIERGWLDCLENCFLIREPEEMLTSLLHFLPEPELKDTGLPQQLEIFESAWKKTGRVPPVVDARDVLLDPRRVLARLCDYLHVAFDEAMLSWPAGRRATDGIWAKYWYSAVEKTTSFQPPAVKNERAPASFQGLLDRCQELYQQLHVHRIH